MSNALVANEIDCLDQFFVSTSPQLVTGAYNIIRLKHQGTASSRCVATPVRSVQPGPSGARTHDQPSPTCELPLQGYADIETTARSLLSSRHLWARLLSPARAEHQDGQGAAEASRLRQGFSTPLLTSNDRRCPSSHSSSRPGPRRSGRHQPHDRATKQVLRLRRLRNLDWLDGEMSMVDYGARSTPNLFLNAPLMTYDKATGTGAWNARASTTPPTTSSPRNTSLRPHISQRSAAKQIETLLLEQTPIIYHTSTTT